MTVGVCIAAFERAIRKMTGDCDKCKFSTTSPIRIADTLEEAMSMAIEMAGTDKVIVFDGSYGSINLSSSMAEFLTQRAPDVSRNVDRHLLPLWLKQRGIDPETV